VEGGASPLIIPPTPARQPSRRAAARISLSHLDVHYLHVMIFPLRSHRLCSDRISVLHLCTGLVVTRTRFTWLVVYTSVMYLRALELSVLMGAAFPPPVFVLHIGIRVELVILSVNLQNREDKPTTPQMQEQGCEVGKLLCYRGWHKMKRPTAGSNNGMYFSQQKELYVDLMNSTSDGGAKSMYEPGWSWWNE